jgi:mRNA-degrading endonuclease toxin of MazEF toxin-antitoxin module
VQTEQVRAVSPSRLGKTVGRVPDLLMGDIDRALRLHLDL